MHRSPVLQRSPIDDDNHPRREFHPGAQMASYDARSPTTTHRAPSHHFSPPTATKALPPYDYQYSSRPSTAGASAHQQAVNQSPRIGPPPSPTSNGQLPSNGQLHHSQISFGMRDQGASTFYDPTQEHREVSGSWNNTRVTTSPTQSRQSEPYYDRNSDARVSRSSYQSPASTRFPNPSPTFSNLYTHPPSRHNSIPQSPPYPNRPSPTQQYNHSPFAGPSNGALERSIIQESGRDIAAYDNEAPPQDNRRTRADPMAFSSILSETPVETPKPTQKHDPPIKQFRKVSRASNSEPTPAASVPRASSNNVERHPAKEPSVSSAKKDPEARKNQAKESKAAMSKSTSVFRVPTKVEQKENEKLAKAMKDIDDMEHSDLESPEFACLKEAVTRRGQKREREIQEAESHRRKRRCMASAQKTSALLDGFVKGGKQRFRQKHEDAAMDEVHQQEIVDEKERKKDMQRKRRREKTVINELQKRTDAMAKAESAGDIIEKEKHLKEAQRAEKKVRVTRRILEVGESVDTIPEVAPMGLNLEGGTMIDFQAGVNPSPEPPKKKTARGQSTRLKKSKEKKQAEKDLAEAAWAAQEQDQLTLTHIAPKVETRKETLMKETKEVKSVESTPAPVHTTNFASKGYQQLYEQIFRDIGRKEILKVYRIRDNSKSAKVSNKGKTAQLGGKEARRWQLRTNKSTKDNQARSKRSMKEMMSFWKRNEREERDMRRVAEKQELDNAKKAEADREANRQKRKLNFLIKQTELYSHFVGSKIKTSELERSTDLDGGVSAPPVESSSAVQMLPKSANKTTKTMEDIDFDNEDESELNEVAAANAHSAVQEAQNRARAFNNEEGDLQAQFDEGEMNFQNPTGFGDMEVEQPKMLTVPLKEYQLKGLNWLVNIYEQGINGILADEMGLGKTVQSISVMGYLAEKHNIWGPFLVIAPLSTLHNWEQEIRRFVPDLRVLPYWGNAKDRKTLRKQWDRKHITYGRDTPFHVTITSYQLVVLDAQYFQKMRWQYMILDEAQAIKSSQSSRWKSLLGFHCRNRLLLTGTPIQNNMQELWALLHFIMPSLFDSHDEFSDWFSKDIESHAQSNTKLNEDQLKRLHMILKPFMLRRLKSNVQKELGDKIELDVFCDLTYRQRAYYGNLRNKISIMDLIEKATVGDDHDTATLMNLVMQFRKVCNHPDLFERAETASPLSMAHFAETASFVREGNSVNLAYSTRNLIEYDLPRLLCSFDGDAGTKQRDVSAVELTLDKPDFAGRVSTRHIDIWNPSHIHSSQTHDSAFSWLRFSDTSCTEAFQAFRQPLFDRALALRSQTPRLARMRLMYDEEDESPSFTPAHAMLNIVSRNDRKPLAEVSQGPLQNLMNVSQTWFQESPFPILEQCARPRANAPPIQVSSSNQAAGIQSQNETFNPPIRKALYGLSYKDEQALLDAKVRPVNFPPYGLLPAPESEKSRFTDISVPSMQRFVTDSGKLAKLDALLRELKNGGHRVLLYFQMTRMIDLMEEYLTYRNYKYCRLDGSTKLEDRRDTVHDFQTRPDIFIFLLSTRAGGLGINLTSADTVIFYDSDWNPTIDSQAMDRAHRLGQTKQVTVYRMITRGTIEERIRKRALQKEEVQRVVISGGQSGATVDFNTRSKENRTKDIAMWLADDDEAKLIEKKEAELAEKGGEEAEGKKGKGKKKAGTGGKKKDVSLEELYHEGEGHFDDGSNKPSGAVTPIDGPAAEPGPKKRGGGGKGSRGGSGMSKKAKTAKQRLAIADGA